MLRAERVLARGASSAARLRTTAPSLVIARTDGGVIVDIDGNEYVDYVLGLGPVILGHRPPAVIESARRSLDRAILYSAQHEAESELAERLVGALPSADVVALQTSGSEAVHLALRVARAATGRTRVVKFDGHYHGWIDPLFVSTPRTGPIPESPTSAAHSVAGQHTSADVTVARWNDLDDLDRALGGGPPAAAVFMEPVPCNFGTIWPDPGYAQGVRELCDRHGAMLVYDEVLTGFRLALGGAQERLGVRPDLTILSKAIASGFPISAVAGSAAALAPAVAGPVRSAGTFNGWPAAIAAGIATLDELARRRDVLYPGLEALAADLATGIEAAAAAVDVPLTLNRVGSVLQLFWGVPGPVTTYAAARLDDRARVAELAGRLLDHGIHVPERGLLLLCGAHTKDHVARTVDAFEQVLRAMATDEGKA